MKQALVFCLTLASAGNVMGDAQQFPDYFGGFKSVRFIDFDAEGSGLGYSVTYNLDRAIASIFVNPTAAPTNSVDDQAQAISAEFERSTKEFERQVKQTGRTALTLIQTGNVDHIGNAHECVSLLATYYYAGRYKVVWQCLMPFNSGYLKLRYTLEPDPSNRDQEMASFNAFKQALAVWIAAHAHAVTPTQIADR